MAVTVILASVRYTLSTARLLPIICWGICFFFLNEVLLLVHPSQPQLGKSTGQAYPDGSRGGPVWRPNQARCLSSLACNRETEVFRLDDTYNTLPPLQQTQMGRFYVLVHGPQHITTSVVRTHCPSGLFRVAISFHSSSSISTKQLRHCFPLPLLPSLVFDVRR
ncbi:hypothetical protein CPB84DRAFT_1752958 [Gymnopilus junonius]|uniref:Uncharacterized protein n=1 Tax=Gymnopilus junonius TaxID=109634 RepID=A0A9P5NAE2_GYMJU|nr:hypothetical protein CPB84DRAFT_1752958 [Gymnopilus junonius]